MIIEPTTGNGRAYIPVFECDSCRVFGQACEIFPAGLTTPPGEGGPPPIQCVQGQPADEEEEKMKYTQYAIVHNNKTEKWKWKW